MRQGSGVGDGDHGMTTEASSDDGPESEVASAASAGRGTSVLLLAAAAGVAALWAARSGAAPSDRSGGAERSRPDTARLLVVNKSGHSLSILDPASGEERARVPTGRSPHEVAVGADGGRAYVTDYGSGDRPGNTVTVVDLRRAEPADTFALGRRTRPHGIETAADGSLWVTTEGSRPVLHLDPESGEILHAVETGQEVTHMVALAGGGDRVYASSIGSGTVTAIDAARGRVLAHLRTGAGAEGMDVAPDGRRVYVTNREAGTLSEIRVDRNEVTRTLEVGRFPIRVAVLPGGEELLVSDARANEVVRVDVSGWEVTDRIPVGSAPVGIQLGPEGRRAFVANTRDDRISVLDVEEGRVTGHLTAGEEPDGMAWVEGRGR